MTKTEMVEKLKIKLLADEVDYQKDSPGDCILDEWKLRTIQIKECKTIADVAKWCQDSAWDLDSFMTFLFKEVFDETWGYDDLHSEHWST